MGRLRLKVSIGTLFVLALALYTRSLVILIFFGACCVDQDQFKNKKDSKVKDKDL